MVLITHPDVKRTVLLIDEIGYNPFLPVIATAWSPTNDDVRKVVQCGADDIMTKPMSAIVLDGKALSLKVEQQLAERVERIKQHTHGITALEQLTYQRLAPATSKAAVLKR